MNKYYCAFKTIKSIIEIAEICIDLILGLSYHSDQLVGKYPFWLAYSLFGRITRNLTWNRYYLTFVAQKITFERLDLIRDYTE